MRNKVNALSADPQPHPSAPVPRRGPPTAIGTASQLTLPAFWRNKATVVGNPQQWSAAGSRHFGKTAERNIAFYASEFSALRMGS